MNNLITIEIAYATVTLQKIITVTVSAESSILEVIKHSSISNFFSELTVTSETPIGIFGKRIDINTYKLQNNDRIEIYRPLAKTPNQRRLERASKKS